MTDLLFNELLDQQVLEVAKFYQVETHYEPYEFVRIIADGPNGTAVIFTETLNPGDSDLPAVMRKYGMEYGQKHDTIEPLTLFIVQRNMGLNMISAAAGKIQPERVITIYGITSDGRYNLAVLPAQCDEDGRLYALPTSIFHWGERNDFQVNVMPYLEFFKANDIARAKEAAL